MAVTRRGGLEEVVAAESSITYVEGRSGELRYRGYSIGDLAQRCTFEEVAFLLWHGELPSSQELEDLRSSLRHERMKRLDLIELLRQAPPSAHPLDVLRYLVSWDALRHPAAWDNSSTANDRKAMEFAAWFPMAVAAYHRLRTGRDAVEPRPDLDTAAAFLFMLTGREPTGGPVRTLDASLVLHADHELNASTFAARVTIATQSNLHAAVSSALGTLAGPRHGGASDRVIQMLEEIGDSSRAEQYVRDELAAKRRIMGFGHRVYRTVDPRSRHLRNMAQELVAGTDRQEWIHILDRLSAIMQRDKNLYPNVDLYAAVVNHEFGIDPAFYTSIFAVSRIVGWTAHAIEQLQGRMIRPVANYTGSQSRALPVAVGA